MPSSPLNALSPERLEAALTSVILNPAYHDVLAILKGMRNGLVYGIRVRFPHAVIMSLLFQSGSLEKRARTIYKATKQHSFNLAKFVGTYKAVLLLLKQAAGGKQREFDTFLAGLVGGWYVFGDRNAVNEQIVLYVVSRVITSFLPRAGPPVPPTQLPVASGKTPTSRASLAPPPGAPYPRTRPPNARLFELYAAVTWGAVMYLFRERRDTLQNGMVNSMQYLYLDSEVWNSVRNFIWHNQ